MENGFRVQIQEDNLKARLEGHDKEYMLERIKILGYLSLHTRQLDMIMSNKTKVNYYHKKINKDIREIVADNTTGSGKIEKPLLKL